MHSVTDDISFALIELGRRAFSNEPPDFPALKTAGQWQEFVATTEMHGIENLLYAARDAIPDMPAEMLEQRRRRYLEATAVNMLALRQLKEILGALEAAEVPAIALKGAAALLEIYDEPALRKLGDFDIMVRGDGASAAREALRGLGYETIAATNAPQFEALHQHLNPMGRKNSFPIELHVALFKRQVGKDEQLDDIWRRSRVIEAEGLRATVLCPEHFLLYSAVHYCNHLRSGGGQLKWLVDMLAGIARWGGSIDWRLFWETARLWDVEGDAARVAATLNHYWDRRIPGIPARSRFIPLETLAAGRPGGQERQPDELASYLERLAEVKDVRGLRNKGEYLLRLAFPTADNLRLRYRLEPSNRLAPYYLMHVFDRAKLTAKLLFKRLKKSG